MGGRPADGREPGGRPGELCPVPPVPPSAPSGAPRTTVRTAERPGPLVARPGLPGPVGPHPSARARPGRLRGFVLRYGWRAYAVPLLAIATIVVLTDLALTTPSVPAGNTGAVAPATVSAPTTPAPLATLPTAPAEGDVEPTEPPGTVGVETYAEQGAGSVTVVDGTSAVLGAGPLRRFIVEVEDGAGVAGATFAQAVEATLGDPRSWGSGGRMSFQRVGAAEAAAGQFDFRVSLISPGSMETYCPGVGTGGYTSCRYGDRAVINLARWATAVPHYDGDVATYRHYVVNHEVGHVFGNGHVDCPGAGQPAPVMVQQTLGLGGCVKNAWPFP